MHCVSPGAPALQLPQVCAVCTPQILPAEHSVEVSWQSPVTQALLRQIVELPQYVSFLHVVSPAQLPQVCGVVMPQIWKVPLQSLDVSWQLPATHWAVLPVPRQMCIGPYCAVSATHCASELQAKQVCVVVLQSWLLPAQSAEVLQLPEMQAPPEQTWFAP